MDGPNGMNGLRLTGLSQVLCIGAHSDDIEIGCGGTLLRILEQNPDCAFHWVVLSATGDRREEALASAHGFLAAAANRSVVTHNFPDRFFPTVLQELKQVFYGMREGCTPDLIFTHRLEDRHQDHRCVAECTWNTFRQHTILEYEIPKYEGDLGQPNLYVTLNRSTCEEKVRLLMQHFGSQREKYWFDQETFWGLLRIRGLEARSSSRYAEGFTARKLTL